VCVSGGSGVHLLQRPSTLMASISTLMAPTSTGTEILKISDTAANCVQSVRFWLLRVQPILVSSWFYGLPKDVQKEVENLCRALSPVIYYFSKLF